ncbi:MAG: hypothetical protein RLZZ458_963 [Planctomycetota bacterium]
MQVMVDNGTGVKEFESATFGMLLKVGLQLVKRFGQIQSDGDRGETIIDSVPAPDGLAPTELKVAATPRQQRHYSPRQACRLPIKQARKLAREPWLQTGQDRLGARGVLVAAG